jgi:hypothetical protein
MLDYEKEIREILKVKSTSFFGLCDALYEKQTEFYESQIFGDVVLVVENMVSRGEIEWVDTKLRLVSLAEVAFDV